MTLWGATWGVAASSWYFEGERGAGSEPYEAAACGV